MPKPVQPGGVPIWVSGRCNRPVARRLARFGHGWIPWGEDAADPITSIPRMRAAVDEAGGDGASMAVLAPVRAMDRAGPLVDAGVTDFLVHVRAPHSYAAALDAYAELVAAFNQVRSSGEHPT